MISKLTSKNVLFWSFEMRRQFEICSNSIFCSQILHRMLLARAITPKARQNSFFRKMLPYFVFFFSNWIFNTLIQAWSRKQTLAEVNKSWTFQNYKNGPKWEFLKKLQTNFLAWIVAHEHEKHRSNQKYRSKIFFEFLRSKKLPVSTEGASYFH